MNSEKMKEIKKVFNTWKIVFHGITNADILTLINELESENERLQNKNYQLEQDLGQCENGYNLELHTARYQLHSANEDLRKAEKRIAELEKENTRLANRITCKVVVPDEKLQEIKKECFKKIELAKSELLKQFAERLKEKGKSTYDFFQCPTKENRVISISDINETLEDFISE